MTSGGFLVVSQPPDSSAAYVDVLPQSHRPFKARDATQAVRDLVEFEFHGFDDVTGVQV